MSAFAQYKRGCFSCLSEYIQSHQLCFMNYEYFILCPNHFNRFSSWTFFYNKW